MVAKASVGYSGSPLISKLGIKPGMKVFAVGAPADYAAWLGPLPENARFVRKGVAGLEFIHLFAGNQSTFEKYYLACKPLLTRTGMLWVSWPKKSSGVETDLTENIIRDFALANGLVDVKVCAVSPVWSALKLVYRLNDR